MAPKWALKCALKTLALLGGQAGHVYMLSAQMMLIIPFHFPLKNSHPFKILRCGRRSTQGVMNKVIRYTCPCHIAGVDDGPICTRGIPADGPQRFLVRFQGCYSALVIMEVLYCFSACGRGKRFLSIPKEQCVKIKKNGTNTSKYHEMKYYEKLACNPKISKILHSNPPLEITALMANVKATASPSPATRFSLEIVQLTCHAMLKRPEAGRQRVRGSAKRPLYIFFGCIYIYISVCVWVI